MNQNRFLKEYQKNTVNSASPLQLVILLYDGAIKCIEESKRAMSEKRYFEQNQSLKKAQNIIIELTSALNKEKGEDIAENLFTIYNFIYDQLVEANIEGNAEKLTKCQNILEELRGSWMELEKQQKEEVAIKNGNSEITADAVV